MTYENFGTLDKTALKNQTRLFQKKPKPFGNAHNVRLRRSPFYRRYPTTGDKVCIIYLRITYHNCTINISTGGHKSLFFASSGKLGLHGSKKGTHYAIEQVIRKGLHFCKRHRYRYGVLCLHAKTQLHRLRKGLKVLRRRCPVILCNIHNKTNLPYGGCRPRKRRRL